MIDREGYKSIIEKSLNEVYLKYKKATGGAKKYLYGECYGLIIAMYVTDLISDREYDVYMQALNET